MDPSKQLTTYIISWNLSIQHIIKSFIGPDLQIVIAKRWININRLHWVVGFFCFSFRIYDLLVSAVFKCFSVLEPVLFVVLVYTTVHLKNWNVSWASYMNKWTDQKDHEAGGCRANSDWFIYQLKVTSGMCYRSHGMSDRPFTSSVEKIFPAICTERKIWKAEGIIFQKD